MTRITTADTDEAIFERLLAERELTLILGNSLVLPTGAESGGVAEATGTPDEVRAAIFGSEFVGTTWYTRFNFGPLDPPSQNGSNEAETPISSVTAVVDEPTTIGWHAVVLESARHDTDMFVPMGGPQPATANSAANTIAIAAADYTGLIGQVVPFVLTTDGGSLPTGIGSGILYGRVDDATTVTVVDGPGSSTPVDFTTDGSSLFFHPAQGRILAIEILDTPRVLSAGQPYPLDYRAFADGGVRA